MITRIWQGYTTPGNAGVYEKLLKKEIIPEIEGKKIIGYRGFQVLRRKLNNEVQFTTFIWFESLEAVKDFVGEDYEQVYVPAKAREVLLKFGDKAIHHELRYESWENAEGNKE